jgi:hypothetical protein
LKIGTKLAIIHNLAEIIKKTLGAVFKVGMQTAGKELRKQQTVRKRRKTTQRNQRALDTRALNVDDALKSRHRGKVFGDDPRRLLQREGFSDYPQVMAYLESISDNEVRRGEIGKVLKQLDKIRRGR